MSLRRGKGRPSSPFASREVVNPFTLRPMTMMGPGFGVVPRPVVRDFSSLAAPAIELVPGSAGRTALGGEPELDAAHRWPPGKSFVFQLDLAEAHAALPSELPAEGLLSLFVTSAYFHDAPGEPPHASVLWSRGPTRAVATPKECELSWPRKPLRCARVETVPHPADWRAPEGDEYRDYAKTRGWHAEATTGRSLVLGHAQWLHGDARLDAAAALRGHSLDPEELHARWLAGEDVLSLVEETSRFRLLFQLFAADGLVSWGSGGSLYVLIQDEDLRAHRFDRVFSVVQCT